MTQPALLEDLVELQERIFANCLAVRALIDEGLIPLVRRNERPLPLWRPLELREAEGSWRLFEAAIHLRISQPLVGRSSYHRKPVSTRGTWIAGSGVGAVAPPGLLSQSSVASWPRASVKGLAYNLSTTAGMAPIPPEKAGVASGALNTLRMVGLAVGVALTGVLVRALEYDRLTELLAAAGTAVGPAERAEIGGLLSGSPDAVTGLSRLRAAAAADVERIVRASYDHGFEVGMILCAALSLAGVAVAITGTGARPALAADRLPRAV